MDELLRLILEPSVDTISGFTITEFIISLILSTVLSSIIATVYKNTHSGLSYSKSFATTMIMMSITICFIMLIIGSNLARAFSLVGALSIIRYRNAVKESRDTAFIFLAMAVGMACGVKIYVLAIIFTLVSSSILFLLEKINFGTVNKEERLLQAIFEQGQDISNFESRIAELSNYEYFLLSFETLNEKDIYVYSLNINSKKITGTSLREIQKEISNSEIKLLTGFEKFNI